MNNYSQWSTTFQGFRDECGIFGIYNHPEAANMTYLGLYALQHRGQESAGIVSTDGNNMCVHRSMGYVADVFKQENIEALRGNSAIGHVRYSTQGGSYIKNAQPVVVSCWRGPLAIAHNGNLVNARELRIDLERKGSIFQTTCDSEVIVHLIAKAKTKELIDALAHAVQTIKGAYSLITFTRTQMVAIRDPNGFRPLVLGILDGSYVVASETCALDLIGADFIRDVKPGEMLVIDENGLTSYYPMEPRNMSFCIFELIYFARPDSRFFGKSVYEIRKMMGKQLAIEHPVSADLIIPVPDSGIGAAVGFSEESKIPFDLGLIRNHYVGRTFIEPKQSIRDFGVKIKLNPIRSLLANKRVVVVDDSIVRGTTSLKLVRMIRLAGAKEVHVRVSSPPTVGPCYYGIDTPTHEELIATQKSVQEIQTHIEADSLGFLSCQGLLNATGISNDVFCVGCFSSRYPIEIIKPELKQIELFPKEI